MCVRFDLKLASCHAALQCARLLAQVSHLAHTSQLCSARSAQTRPIYRHKIAVLLKVLRRSQVVIMLDSTSLVTRKACMDECVPCATR